MLRQFNTKTVFSEEDIAQRIRDLSQDIYYYYDSRGEAFSILYLEKGAKVFAEKLEQEIVKLDPQQKIYQGLNSIVARRTKGTDFLDEVEIDEFCPKKIEGKNILLVEDIIDHGITLDAVIKKLKHLVASYKVCVLVDKPPERKKQINIDHVGFKIDDGWVVGLGMDVNEQGRDLPFIGVIDPV